jgi:hypothetical protein
VRLKQHLPSKLKALGSNPSTEGKKEEERKKPGACWWLTPVILNYSGGRDGRTVV